MNKSMTVLDIAPIGNTTRYYLFDGVIYEHVGVTRPLLFERYAQAIVEETGIVLRANKNVRLDMLELALKMKHTQQQGPDKNYLNRIGFVEVSFILLTDKNISVFSSAFFASNIKAQNLRDLYRKGAK